MCPKLNRVFVPALIMTAAIAACRPATDTPVRPRDRAKVETGGNPMPMVIQSTAFAHNGKIPTRFTGDGEDVSPELRWSAVPASVKELALICDDPDAPTPEPWVHWLIYKIPATAAGLPENVAKSASPASPAGAVQGRNSWGKVGYGGPAPPRGHGVHHYHFKVYALDAPLSLAAGQERKQLLAAMKGHVVAEAELVGTYQR
jgi:hypothetical protein